MVVGHNKKIIAYCTDYKCNISASNTTEAISIKAAVFHTLKVTTVVNQVF